MQLIYKNRKKIGISMFRDWYWAKSKNRICSMNFNGGGGTTTNFVLDKGSTKLICISD